MNRSIWAPKTKQRVFAVKIGGDGTHQEIPREKSLLTIVSEVGAC